MLISPFFSRSNAITHNNHPKILNPIPETLTTINYQLTPNPHALRGRTWLGRWEQAAAPYPLQGYLSLIINCFFLGPYRRPMPGALW